MPVEVTRFDTFLKEHLYRDILFRIMVWLVIAALTARVAMEHISSVEYLTRMGKSLMPVLNKVMSFTVALAAPALILKELEFVDPERWRADTPLAMLGGFVRRLAGDLSLWMVGAMVSLLSATTLVASDALLDTTSTGKGFLAVFWVAAVFGIVLMSTVHIFVRRAEPVFAGHKGFEWVTKPRHVAAMYALILLLYVVAYRFG
jgi:hypothetical protein